MDRYHENLDTLHINTAKPRSFYVPSAPNESYSPYDWEKSSRVKMLNGSWEFKLYNSFQEAHSSLCEFSGYDQIDVPSCYQLKGYGEPQYTNVRYPIPIDPPHVPDENPTAHYRKMFEHSRSLEKVYLIFDGVDSAYYVYLNGAFVGYSQVSHSTAEFDISESIKEGENALDVLVLKWSDGTYLEDQDKFRMSGIFRDVYLLERPARHIRDFSFSTALKDGSASLSLAVEGNAESITARLYDAEGALVSEAECVDKATLNVRAPRLWSAEDPYLYNLVLLTENEKIEKRLGLKTIEIKDSVFLLNGRPIKLKGVNRHDSDPETGFAISKRQLEKDLLLMKRHNINAIRTSHYPSAPFAYDLYDKHGFYVIAEADLEAHGNVFHHARNKTARLDPRGNLEQLYFENPVFGRMVSDDRFEKAVIDRILLNYEQQKNATCKIIWSLGNESGWGSCLEKAARILKEKDPLTPIHYESSIYVDPGRDTSRDCIDLYSRMYPSPAVMEHYAEHQLMLKPFVACEYIHSMGNGPGGIEDYWRVIYSHDTLLGGFAWEWADHSVLKDGKHLYGGDFGEKLHDGNFCVDGLVSPERNVKPGLLEYKNVLRPARSELKEVKDGVAIIRVKNMLDFLNTDAAIFLKVAIYENGKRLQELTFEGGDISAEPRRAREISVPLCYRNEHSLKEIRIEQVATGKHLAPEGETLGLEQLFVERDYSFLSVEDIAASGEIHVEEKNGLLSISGGSFKYAFSEWLMPVSLVVEGEEKLSGAASWSIWRAPTDNDMYIKDEWLNVGYDRTMSKLYSRSIEKCVDAVVIKAEYGVLSAAVQGILSVSGTWTIRRSGRIEFASIVRKEPSMPDLPRFGLLLPLAKGAETFSYFGFGPTESYADKRQATIQGWFSSTADREYVDYIKPQEHGSHCGTRRLDIASLSFWFPREYSINVSRYSVKELSEKRHNFELTKSDSVILHIDYKQNGIGSNSCGPVLDRRYAFDELEFPFCFILHKESKGSDA